MLNLIFWKKVQGQKHPGRWEIGHKHPSISLIITEQDTVGETKENNKWHSTQELRNPQNQSYRL